MSNPINFSNLNDIFEAVEASGPGEGADPQRHDQEHDGTSGPYTGRGHTLHILFSPWSRK